jgi:hypothetical protein
MDLEATIRNRSGKVLVRCRGRSFNAGSPPARFVLQVRPTRLLPLISNLPGAIKANDADRQSSPRGDTGLLQDFLWSTRPWNRERVPIPRPSCSAGWAPCSATAAASA